MKFSPLPKQQTDNIETETLDFWRSADIFAKSVAKNKDREHFSFYDGPPFANGLPHFGHSLVTAIKDSVGRYKTMQGYYVPRVNGWDCHGLPVEYEIEKKFQVSGKKQILELGLEKFNNACRDSVFTYKAEWEGFFERIGRWTDTENAYATVNNSYIESVWWALGQVNDKGLLYRGYKSMPYCPRCETPISNFELNEGYKEGISDPSLYVKFKLSGEDAYLLAWTTTPWSLPGNAAIALAPDAKYVRVELKDDDGATETLILAKNRLEVLDEDCKIIDEFTGKDLAGKSYEPLFEISDLASSENIYRVWTTDFVSIEDGTGVLHVAPAFGEDDLNLANEHKIPILTTVDSSGHLTENTGLAAVNGKFFKSADKFIIEHLTEKNLVFSAEQTSHIYPFCYRCDSPLLYYAVSTWFIKTSELRPELAEAAEPINWQPGHVKAGRFGKWLEGARDWAISRNRYWGSPLPIWINEDDENDYIVISSTKQLAELAEGAPNLEDLHRPYIDDIVIKKDGKTYRRAEEVLDCWFESGSMPFAMRHFPFENETQFHNTFPADYIGEGLDQTRLWFYVLHVLSTILFEKPAYQNVIVNGMVTAADGQKLSKRLKNYPPIDDVFAKEGADSLRYYLLSSPATMGEAMRFSRDGMADINRNLFGTLYNSASFFAMYAAIDDWQPKSLAAPQSLTNPLDIWLTERLAQTNEQITKAADAYDLGRATRPLYDLVDDLSNWYVRRSRKRFWKSENDGDKNEAYATLYFALISTCQLLAPWAPFMSDYLYRQLTQGVEGAAESVHLTAWPKIESSDSKILEQMTHVRALVTEGLSARAGAKIKVRQPLAAASYSSAEKLSPELEKIIADELNVKTLTYKKSDANSIELDTNLTDELLGEGAARDVVRAVQNARKEAGLDVSDRIILRLNCSTDFLARAIEQNKELIAKEVLAEDLQIEKSNTENQNAVKIGEAKLSISIEKR